MRTYADVITTHGVVRGYTDDDVSVFKGVPYGGEVSGDRRFLPPQPARNWLAVRDCTKNGPICLQLGKSVVNDDFFSYYYSGGNKEAFGVADETQDENCLNLNILTPACDDAKRAVLVYFHGGGFITNSSTIILGSSKLVRENDIVTVGVNHRLNVFGFLHLGAFDERYKESGMAGMLDLVMSLEWIRDNILRFGGDPDKVTIMGESGGGMKVSTLMAMPKAQGLFRHAVVESGSMPIDDFSIEQATDLARKFMDELNISPDNLGKLTELTGAEIMSAYLSLCGKVMSMPFQPVADGINLLYREKGFHTYPWSANIPLMVGSAEDENAIFIPVDEILSVTAENLRGKLLGTSIFSPADGFAGERKINETNVDEILCAFGRHNYKGDSARHLYVKIKSMASFLGMGAFYQTMEKARNGSASVYHYIVAKDTPHLAHQQFARDTASDSRFAWHTAELPLQFGIVYYPEDAAFSEKLRGSLAAFVKTGDPSTPALPWPAITETDRNVMLYDDSCEIRSDPWKEMREALEGGVC